MWNILRFRNTIIFMCVCVYICRWSFLFAAVDTVASGVDAVVKCVCVFTCLFLFLFYPFWIWFFPPFFSFLSELFFKVWGKGFVVTYTHLFSVAKYDSPFQFLNKCRCPLTKFKKEKFYFKSIKRLSGFVVVVAFAFHRIYTTTNYYNYH